MSWTLFVEEVRWTTRTDENLRPTGDGPPIIDGVTVTWSGAAELTIDSAPWWLRMLSVAPLVIVLIAVAVVSTHLLAVVARGRAGRPFTADSPRRLAVVARTITGTAILAGILHAAAGSVIMDWATGGTRDDFDLPLAPMLGWVLAGLVVEVIATAFHHGLRLTEDTEGLV